MTRWDEVEVCVDLERFGKPVAMGWLRRQRARSGEVFSFEYARPWLDRSDAFAFDPDLALVRGPQYPAAGRELFGIFPDSSPDRWGRVLMQRREALRARREGRRPRTLSEWDFLLGVHDETRLGALRFRASWSTPSRPEFSARHSISTCSTAPSVAESSSSAPPSGASAASTRLAGAAVFLASEAASFVNGEVLVVDGGFLASGVNQ